MTTQAQAMHAAGLLIGSIGGFNEDAAKVFVEQFQKHTDDGEALVEVCDQMSTTWPPGKFRPSLGEVLDEYRKHPSVAAERAMSAAAALGRSVGTTRHCTGTGATDGNDGQRPCPRCSPYLADVYADRDKWERYLAGTPLHELHPAMTLVHGVLKAEVPMPAPCKIDTRHDPERFISVAEGMQYARDEHKALFGRDMGEAPAPNPVFAIDVIQKLGRFDPYREVWTTTYAKVLAEFGDDPARTRASLKAIGARLTHANNGNLTLRPDDAASQPEAPYTSPAPSGAAEPPSPSERPLSATGLLSEALGKTRSAMMGDEG